jgi:hypothetical protein
MDIKQLPEQMSYPEEEHSIITGEQCLSKVSSVVDEHFPVIESTVNFFFLKVILSTKMTFKSSKKMLRENRK